MKTIMLISPYLMTAKTFLTGALLDSLLSGDNVKIHLVVPDEFELSENFWHDNRRVERHSIIRWKNQGSVFLRLYFFLGFVIHLCLVYRFNSLSRFSGFGNRVRQSLGQKFRELLEGIPSFRIFGFPLPQSVTFYKAIQHFYYRWFCRSKSVERMMTSIRPDVLVIFHCQNHPGLFYTRAALKNNIRTMGVIGSWDQPTTKGPIYENLDDVLTPTAFVKEELIRWHGVLNEITHVFGWPQLDSYFDERAITKKKNIQVHLGIEADQGYLVFGAYGGRLGKNEENLISSIAHFLENNIAFKNIFLLVRPHPLDLKSESRYSELLGKPKVIIETQRMREHLCLPEILRNSIGVISSGGTILLDGLASDIPALGIAFERDAENFYECSARRFEMEHWRTAISLGCIIIASNVKELQQNILNLVTVKSRSKLYAYEMEKLFGCLDGKSTLRLSNFILSAAHTS